MHIYLMLKALNIFAMPLLYLMRCMVKEVGRNPRPNLQIPGPVCTNAFFQVFGQTLVYTLQRKDCTGVIRF